MTKKQKLEESRRNVFSRPLARVILVLTPMLVTAGIKHFSVCGVICKKKEKKEEEKKENKENKDQPNN